MRFRYVFILLVLALAIGAQAALYVINQLDRSNTIIARVAFKLEGYYTSMVKTGAEEVDYVYTNRLILEKQVVNLPLAAADFAGGITEIGGSRVLLLDRVGAFFIVSPDGFEQLDMEPPPNHLDVLLARSEAGTLSNNKVAEKWFRYNDILLAESAAGPLLLASYSEWHDERECFTNTLAQLSLGDRSIDSDLSVPANEWAILARTEPCLEMLPTGAPIRGLEAGGRIAQSPSDPNHVIWTSGMYERGDLFDGEDYRDALGMRDGSQYGRVLRVSLESGEISELARGLRNPQGLTIDGQDRIWVTDHGQSGGDELNVVTEDANFGYPAVSYGVRYGGAPIGDGPLHAQHDGYDEPAMAFVPSIAPSSALALEGFHPAWNGDVLVGSFKDAIYRVRVLDGRGVLAEPFRVIQRVRDLAMTEDGSIAVWSDDRRMVFLKPRDQESAADVILSHIGELEIGSEDREELEAAFSTCTACHSFDGTPMDRGPSLRGICGQPIAAQAFANYSDALASRSGTWTVSELAAFIQAPEDYAPGTNMGYPGLERIELASTLAEAICTAG